jgi:hypothetical protein
MLRCSKVTCSITWRKSVHLAGRDDNNDDDDNDKSGGVGGGGVNDDDNDNDDDTEQDSITHRDGGNATSVARPFDALGYMRGHVRRKPRLPVLHPTSQ